MFIDNRWVMNASELTRSERKILTRTTTLGDVYNESDNLTVFGIMATTIPGGFVLWPVILFTLADGGSPWWGYIVMIFAVFAAAFGFPWLVKQLGVRAVRKTESLRAARTVKYSPIDVQYPWCPSDAGLIEYLLRAIDGDTDLLERHPSTVDAFLRDIDNMRSQELVASGNVSRELHDGLRERLCTEADTTARAIRSLDEPHRLALQAEQHGREQAESYAQLERQMEDEATRYVADEEARFLLGET